MKYMDLCPSVEEYPVILSELYKFINGFGDFDYLPEVILEFCSKNNFSPECIADVISNDNSFKLALELNCISQGVFRETQEEIGKEVQEIDEW